MLFFQPRQREDAVDVNGRLDAPVAHQLGHDGRGRSLLKREDGQRVAKLVGTQIDSGLFADPPYYISQAGIRQLPAAAQKNG